MCDRGRPCYGGHSVHTDDSSPGLRNRTKDAHTELFPEVSPHPHGEDIGYNLEKMGCS